MRNLIIMSILILSAWISSVQAIDIQYQSTNSFNQSCEVEVDYTYYQGDIVSLSETFRSDNDEVLWQFYNQSNAWVQSTVFEYDPNQILSSSTYQQVSNWRPFGVSDNIIAFTNANNPHTFSNSIPDWINPNNPVAQIQFVLYRQAFPQTDDPWLQVNQDLTYRLESSPWFINWSGTRSSEWIWWPQSEIECANLYLERCGDWETQTWEWEVCDNWDFNGTWQPWSDGRICSSTCEVVEIPSECTDFNITPTVLSNWEVVVNYTCQWVGDNFVITQTSPDWSTQTRTTPISNTNGFQISSPGEYTYTCAVDWEINGCTQTYTIEPPAICNWISVEELSGPNWSTDLAYNCVWSWGEFEVDLFVDWSPQPSQTSSTSQWRFVNAVQPWESYQVICSVWGVSWPQCDSNGEVEPAEECSSVNVTQTELAWWTQISYACVWNSDTFSAMLKSDDETVLETNVWQSWTFQTLIDTSWVYRVECLIDWESTIPACLYDFTIDQPSECTSISVQQQDLWNWTTRLNYQCGWVWDSFRAEFQWNWWVINNTWQTWFFETDETWSFWIRCYVDDVTSADCQADIFIEEPAVCDSLSVVENTEWTQVSFLCQWTWWTYSVELRDSSWQLIESSNQASGVFDISWLWDGEYDVTCSVGWETSSSCQWVFTVDPNAECQDVIVSQNEVANGVQLSYECVGTWWPYSAMVSSTSWVIETMQWQTWTFNTIIDEAWAYRVKCLIDWVDAWCQEDVFIEPEPPVCGSLVITNTTSDGLPETISATCEWTGGDFETVLIRNGQQVPGSSRVWPQSEGSFSVTYTVTEEGNYNIQCYVWWVTSNQCIDHVTIEQPPEDIECTWLSVVVTDDGLPETIGYNCSFEWPWVSVELENTTWVIQTSDEPTGEFVVDEAWAYRVTCYVWDERVTSQECMEDILVEVPEEPDVCQGISTVVGDNSQFPVTVGYSCIWTWWPYSAMLVDTAWNSQTSQGQQWSFEVDQAWIYWIKCLIDGQPVWSQCQDDFLIESEPTNDICEDISVVIDNTSLPGVAWYSCIWPEDANWSAMLVDTTWNSQTSQGQQWSFQINTAWIYWIKCLIDGELAWSQCQDDFLIVWEPWSVCEDLTISTSSPWVWEAVTLTCTWEGDMFEIQVKWPDGSLSTVWTSDDEFSVQYTPTQEWTYKAFCLVDGETNLTCDHTCSTQAHELVSIYIQEFEWDALVPSWVYQATTTQLQLTQLQVEINTVYQVSYNEAIQYCENDCEVHFTVWEEVPSQQCDISLDPITRVVNANTHTVEVTCSTVWYENVGVKCFDDAIVSWNTATCAFEGRRTYPIFCTSNQAVINWCQTNVTLKNKTNWWSNFCGDGKVRTDKWEECDDGNNIKWDWCFQCKKESKWWWKVSSIDGYCGDGKINAWEECDAWSKNWKNSICDEQCTVKNIWVPRTEEETERLIKTWDAPKCAYVDPPSVQAKEILPIRREVEEATNSFTCDWIDDWWTVNPLTMECAFEWVAPSWKSVSFTRPCYTQELKEANWYGDFEAWLWYEISPKASMSYLDTSWFSFDEYWEYRIMLVWIEYDICIATETTITDSEWNVSVEVTTEVEKDQLSDQRICQMNVPVTTPYYLNKWSSLTSTSDDKVVLDRFKAVDWTVLTPLVESDLQLKLASTDQLDSVKKEADAIANTASRLVDWWMFWSSIWLKKIPQWNIYVTETDMTIIGSSVSITEPTTLIVKWDQTITIKWSLDANLFIVAPEWTIVFESIDCDIREVVSWVYIAKRVLWGWSLANDSLEKFDWCNDWWLTIKWMLIWVDKIGFMQLKQSRRSTLNTWFKWWKSITDKVFEWASLRIENDAIAWSNLPPLAASMLETVQVIRK